MLKRHDDALMAHIDQLARLGWAELQRWQLLLWYEQQRVTKRIWRDIEDRYLALTALETADLAVRQSEDGRFLVVDKRVFENIGALKE